MTVFSESGWRPVRASATPSGFVTCPRQRRGSAFPKVCAEDEPGAVLKMDIGVGGEGPRSMPGPPERPLPPRWAGPERR